MNRFLFGLIAIFAITITLGRYFSSPAKSTLYTKFRRASERP